MSARELVRMVPRGVRERAKDALRTGLTLGGSPRTLPDFIIIGAQRGGTTSLYSYLVRHPDVSGALLAKEVHYFDLRYERGDGWYRRFFPTEAARRRHLASTGRQLVVGEASPYYMFHPAVPERVARSIPDVRLIVMLRDPVQRAFSHYRHEVRLGYEPLTFEEAIEREAERTAGEEERLASEPGYVSFAHQHHTYVSRGEYEVQMARWLDRFSLEQILVIGSERFFADPEGQMRGVEAFLGLTAHSLDRYETFNASPAAGLDPAVRRRLQDHFRPHNERLFERLGFGFDWG
jgi:hypothetical protein